MKRAGFWIRTLALAIDLAAYLVLVAVLAVTTRFSARTANWVYCLAWLAYSSFEMVFAATPGKMLLRLRIANQDGSPASGWKLSLRWSTKQLPFILGLMLLISPVGLVRMLAGLMEYLLIIGCLFASTDLRLTWHDEWAYTAVYRRPKAPEPRGLAVVQNGPPPLPAMEPSETD
jgi:uncharacterized RDD family membrane protein YckC